MSKAKGDSKMTVKELFENLEATNKLQEVLQAKDRASVQIYVDDVSYGHECHNVYEFKYYLESYFTEDFINQIMEADFVKTYSNTLFAEVEMKMTYIKKSIKQKVELFVDMGGF